MRSESLAAEPTNSILNRGLPALIALVACLMAGQLFVQAWEAGDAGWWWLTHDRHAHYVLGMNLAFDVQTLDLARLRHDLNALRVWGPLHALLQFPVQLVAGPDHRLAILPNLAAWVATVTLAFLITRRTLPQLGNLAGCAAAAILAALPAYRAYAADVMLESLGVMLTLLVLYGYLVAVQDDSPRAGRLLAVSLIALFFHKYNYWLIVVAGLVIAEFLRRPSAWLAFARVSRSYFAALLKKELRQPLFWIALVVFTAACFVWLRRGVELSFGTWRWQVSEPHALFWVAFVAFFVRLVAWWRREGRELSFRLDPRVRPVIVWHSMAASFWFLLPKRLGYFFWFLSPAHSTAKFKSTTILDGFWFYLGALREDYCVWPWQLGLLLGFVVVAVILARRLQPGSVAVFTVFAVGALLAMQYAMTKHRFAHTWAAPGWILAVVGFFAFLSMLGNLSRIAGSLVVLALAVIHAPFYLEPGRGQESGARAHLANPRSITNAYLPAVADAHHVTILSNVPAKYLFTWTFLEALGHANFATDVKQFREKLQHDPLALKAWLAQTKSDALVLVEILPHSPHAPELILESSDLMTMNKVLREQDSFAHAQQWQLPEGVNVTLWRRIEGVTRSSGKGVQE